jgi:hypothetical protein
MALRDAALHESLPAVGFGTRRMYVVGSAGVNNASSATNPASAGSRFSILVDWRSSDDSRNILPKISTLLHFALNILAAALIVHQSTLAFGAGQQPEGIRITDKNGLTAVDDGDMALCTASLNPKPTVVYHLAISDPKLMRLLTRAPASASRIRLVRSERRRDAQRKWRDQRC